MALFGRLRRSVVSWRLTHEHALVDKLVAVYGMPLGDYWSLGLRRIVMMVVGLCAISVVSCGTQTVSDGRTSHDLIVARGDEVLLVPPMQSGVAGWCLVVGSPSGCPMARIYRGPIVALGLSYVDGSLVEVALTASEVAAVSVDGRSVTTRAESALPNGLRAVVVEIPGTRGRIGFPRSLPRFTPLNASGQPIPQSRESGKSSIVFDPFVLRWQSPKPESHGICRIEAVGLHGLTAQWGSVVTQVRSYHGFVRRPFLSCVNTEFYLENWPLLSAVLLDASRPGTVPAPLPAMKPIAKHPGVFNAISDEGSVVVRRIKGAWLVVAGGRGLQQRVILLEHLRATVHP
jgi:hypothetical protein